MTRPNPDNQTNAKASVNESLKPVVIGQRTLVGADTGTPTHRDGPSPGFKDFAPEAVARNPKGTQQILGDLSEMHQLSVGAEPTVPYGGSRPSLGLIHFVLVLGLVVAGIWAAARSGWKSKR